MRSNVDGLKGHFNRLGAANVKGAWGMVLAPNNYYEAKEHKRFFAAACELCDYMKEKTDARIMLASIDYGIVKYKAGFWPK